MADPTRPWSLRSRVALAAALGAVVVAVVAGVVVAALLTHREVTTLDRRLDAVVAVAQNRLSRGAGPAELLGAGRRGLLPATVAGLVVTVRSDAGTRTAGLVPRPPELPATDGAVSAGGTDYRVRTAALSGGGTVTVGLPARATDRTVVRVRKGTVLVTGLAALAAAGLGWLLAGPATRPLRELRDRTARLGGRPGPADRLALTSGSVARTAETAEVADAVAGLLHRVD